MIKLWLKTRKKRENMEIKEILYKSHSTRWFSNEIHSLPNRADAIMPEGALTSFTVGYVTIVYTILILWCDAIDRYFADQA